MKINRLRNFRNGLSLMEVIAGLVLTTLLLVPMLGLLRASSQIWRQFESGHGAIAVRQSAIQEIKRRVDGGTRLVAANRTQLRFQGPVGDNQRIYQTGNRIFWQHAGLNDLIAEGVGPIQFRQVSSGGSQAQGDLVEIRVANLAGTNIANGESIGLMWLRSGI
jgi:hypothetical protein